MESPGRGVEGIVRGQRLLLSNHRAVHETGLCSSALEAELSKHEQQGRTLTLLADDKRVLAFFAVVLQGVLGGLRVVLFKDLIGIFHAALAQMFSGRTMPLKAAPDVATTPALVMPDQNGQLRMLAAETGGTPLGPEAMAWKANVEPGVYNVIVQYAASKAPPAVRLDVSDGAAAYLPASRRSWVARTSRAMTIFGGWDWTRSTSWPAASTGHPMSA